MAWIVFFFFLEKRGAVGISVPYPFRPLKVAWDHAADGNDTRIHACCCVELPAMQ